MEKKNNLCSYLSLGFNASIYASVCMFVDPSVLQLVINLPYAVISCLAAVLNYLENFALQKALQDTR